MIQPQDSTGFLPTGNLPHGHKAPESHRAQRKPVLGFRALPVARAGAA